ncbi:MAG: dihydroorotate dehydrogenase [Candidatus Omnitrophica bacterium]|nr:dihydroorotate dehydrogenase [Candidatus Omnitrophota bacterium]
MVDLSVKIGKLKLKNPVMAASGTFGPEYGELTDINSLGAYITKTITLKPRQGNPPPRIAETASGMLNSIGLENNGVEDFIKDKLPKLSKIKIPIIVSIAGEYDNELKELAKRLNKIKRINALELNLSCPNIKRAPLGFARGRQGAQMIAQDKDATYEIVKAVRRSTALTVIVKLSPNVTDITEIAKAAESAGADSVSLVNTFLGIAVDIETKRPKLGNVTGGLSGPAIKPLALKFVRDAYKCVKIPVIGIGGIMDYKDAIEFMLCGAAAVQIGTANFVNPDTSIEIIGGIRKYLAINKIKDARSLIGKLEI